MWRNTTQIKRLKTPVNEPAGLCRKSVTHKPDLSLLTITIGNSKTGRHIGVFSLDAGKEGSCVGATKVCEKVCYAKKGRFKFNNLQHRYFLNRQASLHPDFVNRVVQKITLERFLYFRIHVSGDFYNAAYIQKWHQIARRCPNVYFYAYTRSWRKTALVSPLQSLAALDNLSLFLSADQESGTPPAVPNTRVAYLQLDDEDVPDFDVDMYFRNKKRTLQKRVLDVIVCPLENGTKAQTSCQQCQLCFNWDKLAVANREVACVK